jgi:HPt (histidine-containing phosphotransfer) domain-containing protein
MDGFLMKPVTPRELLEVIDRCRGTGAGRAVGFPAGRAVADEPPGEMRAVEDVRGSKGSKDEDVRLDRKEILSRLDNDTVLLGRIVDMYLDQAPEQIAELGRFIAAGDARGLERAAHKLKGSVGYFGAREAMSAALRLEEIGRTGTLAEAGPALDRLERELGRFAKALRDLRKESAA